MLGDANPVLEDAALALEAAAYLREANIVLGDAIPSPGLGAWGGAARGGPRAPKAP